MARRIGRGALVATLVAAALAGCTDAPPLTNTAVLTINESRARYLDALCPLRADEGFWQPVGGTDRAAVVRRLAVAEPAVARLAEPPKPYPRLLRPSMTRLVAVLRGNLAYFEAVRDDGTASGRPSAVPDALIAEVESRVTVSSAPGSGACTGHLPTASPSASPS